MTDLSVFFAGTAGSVPTARRGLPAVLVRRGGARLLFDCGEGTQRQLLRSVGLADLDYVFLTHHHVDHWLGLLGMVKSFALRDREQPLVVYGPPGTEKLMGAMGGVIGRLPYPFEVVDLAAGDALDFDDGFSVEAFNVRHRGTAFGYALVEQARPGRFDAERAAASLASSSLVCGPALAPIEPEMSIPITSARLARRRSCLRSNDTGEISSSGVFA